MENKYYKTEIDIISDFMSIFDVIPSEKSRTAKAFIDKEGNLRSFSFDGTNQITHDPEKAIDRQEIFNVPINRRANADEEFSIVFESEFNKSGAYDKEVFKRRHIEICQAKRDELIRFNNQALEHHIHTLDRYIIFLQREVLTEKATKNFADFLILKENEDPEKIIEGLRKIFGAEKGKNIAIMLIALEELKRIAYSDGEKAKLYDSIHRENFKVGTPWGINKVLSPYRHGKPEERNQIITKYEIQLYIEKIKSVCCF